MGGVGGTERPKGPFEAGRCTRRAGTQWKTRNQSAAIEAGLRLTAAGLAGSAAHPDHPGSATIRRRAVSAASSDPSRTASQAAGAGDDGHRQPHPGTQRTDQPWAQRALRAGRHLSFAAQNRKQARP